MLTPAATPLPTALIARIRLSESPGKPTPLLRLRYLGLTPREAEIALLVGRGFHQSEVAEHLHVTTGTVKKLLARGREKLGCRDAHELRVLLLRERFVLPEDLIDPHAREPQRP